MKVSETKSSLIDEGPLDLLTKSGRAQRSGRKTLKLTFDNLKKEFAYYLGTQDKKIATATGQDVASFLKSKSHATKTNIPSGVLTKQQIDNILMTASKEAISGQGGISQTTTATPSDQEVKKRVPNELYQALLKLTPEEKKQLAELI